MWYLRPRRGSTIRFSLDRMLDRLVHRGPDEEGTHHDVGVAFGVRRLRVIDPAGGHQPVRNEAGSVWAVMNGEIYNYRELREGADQKGPSLSVPIAILKSWCICTKRRGRKRSTGCGECLPTPYGIESGILCCWFAIAWGSNLCTTLLQPGKAGAGSACALFVRTAFTAGRTAELDDSPTGHR